LASFGGGAFASRSVAVGGTASALAAREVKKKILKIASHMLEARIDDLTFENGLVRVKGTSTPLLSLQDIADNAYVMANTPLEMEPGLEASATFDPPNFTFSNGVVVAKVEVDIETGVVTPLSLCIVHDCGTIIDAALVEGQIQGAVAQGLGEALLEEMIYDPAGQPLSGTFTDYLLPSAQTMPDLIISHMESPTPVNLLGAKGVGESGSIGTPVAIANAVEDALSSFDCNVSQLPLKPENILNVVNAGTSAEFQKYGS
jgi:aerobic carbon-monoxide dehydrogenase large subunit